MNSKYYFALFIVLFILAIIFFILLKKYKFIDTFIVTVEEYILGADCPDYCAYDGSNYYLVFNNKEFDGINNPLIFNNKTDLIYKLDQLKCSSDHYLKNLILLKRKTNHDDPQEDLERKCAKQIALNNFSIDKCAFNYAYSTPEIDLTNINSNNNISKLEANKLLNLEFEIKNMSDSEKQKQALDNYKMIRQLVDFINQNDESVMIDYDLETCMFQKVGELLNGQPSNNIPNYLKQQNLGSIENLHKFRKHFSNKLDDNNNTVDNTYLDNESMKDFIDYFNKANNVILDNVIDEIYDDTNFERY